MDSKYDIDKVVESTRFIEWVDGCPVQRSIKAVTKAGLNDLIPMVLAQPYKPADPEDAENNRGKNNAEVMIGRLVGAATQGHLSSTREVLDRTVGKAAQEITNINVGTSYKEYLDLLINEAEAEVVENGTDNVDEYDIVALPDYDTDSGANERATINLHEGAEELL